MNELPTGKQWNLAKRGTTVRVPALETRCSNAGMGGSVKTEMLSSALRRMAMRARQLGLYDFASTLEDDAEAVARGATPLIQQGRAEMVFSEALAYAAREGVEL